MFAGAWLYLIALMLLASVLLRNGLLFVVSLALLLVTATSRLWERYCLQDVEYRRQFSLKRAFFGEEIEFTVEIVNRKMLPLAWLDIEDEIPSELTLLKGKALPHYKPGRKSLRNLLSLRWYERVRRHYLIRCDARGYHPFGPAQLRSGDVFGFQSRELLVPGQDHLLVYPRVIPISRLGLPSKDPFGDLRTRHWMFEDPLRTAGVRDYVYGDSPRRIHWKATARAQELRVRLYEPTTTYKLAVFLNLNTYGPFWWLRHDPDMMELAICTAASVANWAVEQGYQVGLWVNGSVRMSEQEANVALSRDPDQLSRILELLAKIVPFATTSFETLLSLESRNVPYGATLVVVTLALTDEVLAELIRLKAAGRSVAVLFVGDEGPVSGPDHIWIHRIGGAEAWRELRRIDNEHQSV